MGIWMINRDTIGVIIGNIGMILYRKWVYFGKKMGVITFMLFILVDIYRWTCYEGTFLREICYGRTYGFLISL